MKAMKKKNKPEISVGGEEDITSVPERLSAKEQARKRISDTPSNLEMEEQRDIELLKNMMESEKMMRGKPESTEVYKTGGKIGRGCGAAMKGGGSVLKAMKKSGY